MAVLKVSKYIKKEMIVFLKADKKKEALKELSRVITRLVTINEKPPFIKRLLMREKIMSTGIGLGIAVPHLKLESINDFIVAIGINKNGIEYDSLDNEPVNIILMIIAPARRHYEYLKLLAKIVLVLKQASVREKIIQAETSAEVFLAFKNK